MLCEVCHVTSVPPAGARTIVLPVLLGNYNRPTRALQSSREGGTLNQQGTRATTASVKITKQERAILKTLYEMAYETAGVKRSSYRKQRAKRICMHSDFR